VETVEGRFPAADLGFTLAHEHVLYALLGWRLDHVPQPSFAEQVDVCVDALRPAAAGGVRALVDLTTVECGRDVALLAEVARRTGIRIVCATGLYARRPAPHFARRTASELEAFFLREATDGIGATAVKPGVVKCAIDGPELTGHEAAALTACTRVALRAGLPLVVHIEPGGAPTVLREAREHSLPGRRLVIAHGESAGLEGLIEIVEANDAYVGFDRFGLETALTDEARIAGVVELCKRGFAHRILLSHDTIGLFLGRDRGWASARPEFRNWNFGHLTTTILPRLAAEGVPPAAIEQMTVANPAALMAAA
jgi:phosphotriesterase-related protein